MVEWSSADVVPSRRSSRNFGTQRRAWHHLLRANPDEHDPTSVEQTSTESPPCGEQTGQKSRLPKSSSMKGSSDSVKSEVSSTSRKVPLSQHARVSDSHKGMTFDRKRLHKKSTADVVESSKKPRHASIPRHTAESSVSAAASAVSSQSGITYRFTENGLVHNEQETAPDLSFLSYR